MVDHVVRAGHGDRRHLVVGQRAVAERIGRDVDRLHIAADALGHAERHIATVDRGCAGAHDGRAVQRVTELGVGPLGVRREGGLLLVGCRERERGVECGKGSGRAPIRSEDRPEPR